MAQKPNLMRSGLIAGLCMITLSGCATLRPSGGYVKSNLMRSVETAPTALQLACASAMADHFQTSGLNVLPLHSERKSNTTFEVIVGSTNTKAQCLINQDAEIVQMQRIIL
ncbi:MAG: hypothetical protein AAGE61_08115 [Pseudomonadota bacterium]